MGAKLGIGNLESVESQHLRYLGDGVARRERRTELWPQPPDLRRLPHRPTNRKIIQMTGLGVPLVGVVRRGGGTGRYFVSPRCGSAGLSAASLVHWCLPPIWKGVAGRRSEHDASAPTLHPDCNLFAADALACVQSATAWHPVCNPARSMRTTLHPFCNRSATDMPPKAAPKPGRGT